ncbi:MAG: RnfH family protein [Gammaproteobacteria bacterium]|nr:RnfH family protein [Gammaproteobacteria bacterium]MCW8988582.1 RnfH family protein [Gammaproteobacteria bacterium]MCW9031878.1 RnfH family protein [Gammaproteobacteria bacterium]
MDNVERYFVEVVYALPDEQVLINLDVGQGTTAEQAVKLSGILERFPEIDLTQNKIGIFGKVINADQVLRDKDRVEIYRPLIADPKESRRKRADKKEARTTKGS